MMFPSAVQGHMPFVDKYKQEQIKRVLEKTRSRHHSGPDSRSASDKSAKHKNTHSMPILWQSVYSGQRRRFISMPTLDDSHLGLSTTKHSHSHRSPDNTKYSKGSLLSSLKKLFSSKKDDNTQLSSSKSSKHGSTGAIVQGNHSRPYSSKSAYKKPADNDIVVMSGGRSPKRQRMRTVSNISGVMETIQEVNEIMASTDRLSDPDDSTSSSEETLHSIASAPELGSTNLIYSCSNLSNYSDSSSSQHSSADLICVA